jgi:hypothetical protein
MKNTTTILVAAAILAAAMLATVIPSAMANNNDDQIVSGEGNSNDAAITHEDEHATFGELTAQGSQNANPSSNCVEAVQSNC